MPERQKRVEKARPQGGFELYRVVLETNIVDKRLYFFTPDKGLENELLAASQPKMTLELPEAPLIFVDSALFKSVYVEDTTFSHSVKNRAEGKYLIYA